MGSFLKTYTDFIFGDYITNIIFPNHGVIFGDLFQVISLKKVNAAVSDIVDISHVVVDQQTDD